MSSPPNITTITPPRVPLVDPRTGMISREWYRFFLNLFTLTSDNANAGTIEDLEKAPPVTDYGSTVAALQNQLETAPYAVDYGSVLASVQTEVETAPLAIDYGSAIATLQNELETEPPTSNFEASLQQLRSDLEIGTQPPVIPTTPQNYGTLPTAITVTASPFTYINQTGGDVDVIVSGGGISLLEFSRNGATFYSTGSFYGMFSLSPYDRLRATYVSAPTMTLVPR
jgi:hypothetical protein